MPLTAFEPCPGCQAPLPALDGPTHRYIGASPACWAIYAENSRLMARQLPLAAICILAGAPEGHDYCGERFAQ